VADPVIHRGSGLGTLPLFHAERHGIRASVKGPPVVKVAKDVNHTQLGVVRAGKSECMKNGVSGKLPAFSGMGKQFTENVTS
jgi:hypothetical protein